MREGCSLVAMSLETIKVVDSIVSGSIFPYPSIYELLQSFLIDSCSVLDS